MSLKYHQQFAVVGMCIGGPYILNLLKTAPDRIVASVVMQTIGRDNNYQEFLDMFNGWADGLQAQNPQHYPRHLLDPMRQRMLENDLTFMCMSEAEVQQLSAHADYGRQRYLSSGLLFGSAGPASASGPASCSLETGTRPRASEGSFSSVSAAAFDRERLKALDAFSGPATPEVVNRGAPLGLLVYGIRPGGSCCWCPG